MPLNEEKKNKWKKKLLEHPATQEAIDKLNAAVERLMQIWEAKDKHERLA